eukprot:g15235.t1
MKPEMGFFNLQSCEEGKVLPSPSSGTNSGTNPQEPGAEADTFKFTPSILKPLELPFLKPSTATSDVHSTSRSPGRRGGGNGNATTSSPYDREDLDSVAGYYAQSPSPKSTNEANSNKLTDDWIVESCSPKVATLKQLVSSSSSASSAAASASSDRSWPQQNLNYMEPQDRSLHYKRQTTHGQPTAHACAPLFESGPVLTASPGSPIMKRVNKLKHGHGKSPQQQPYPTNMISRGNLRAQLMSENEMHPMGHGPRVMELNTALGEQLHKAAAGSLPVDTSAFAERVSERIGERQAEVEHEKVVSSCPSGGNIHLASDADCQNKLELPPVGQSPTSDASISPSQRLKKYGQSVVYSSSGHLLARNKHSKGGVIPTWTLRKNGGYSGHKSGSKHAKSSPNASPEDEEGGINSGKQGDRWSPIPMMNQQTFASPQEKESTTSATSSTQLFAHSRQFVQSPKRGERYRADRTAPENKESQHSHSHSPKRDAAGPFANPLNGSGHGMIGTSGHTSSTTLSATKSIEEVVLERGEKNEKASPSKGNLRDVILEEVERGISGKTSSAASPNRLHLDAVDRDILNLAANSTPRTFREKILRRTGAVRGTPGKYVAEDLTVRTAKPEYSASRGDSHSPEPPLQRSGSAAGDYEKTSQRTERKNKEKKAPSAAHARSPAEHRNKNLITVDEDELSHFNMPSLLNNMFTGENELYKLGKNAPENSAYYQRVKKEADSKKKPIWQLLMDETGAAGSPRLAEGRWKSSGEREPMNYPKMSQMAEKVQPLPRRKVDRAVEAGGKKSSASPTRRR